MIEEYYNLIKDKYGDIYRIILENDDEKLDKDYIEYDKSKWVIEDDVNTYLDSIINKNISDEEKILLVYRFICLNYIYDDNALYFLKKRKDENGNTYYISNDWYARVLTDDWLKNRKNHNRRVCYEYSRCLSKAIKKILAYSNNTKIKCCMLGLNDNSHYISGIYGEYNAMLDLDDFNKLKDLTRVKLNLKIKGITILSDKNNILTNAINNYNKDKLDDLKEVEKLDKTDFINYLNNIINILKKYNLDPQGFMEYMKDKIESNDIETERAWKLYITKPEKSYVRCLYFKYNNDYYLLDTINQKLEKQTMEYIDKNYILNPEENLYSYYGG